MWVGCVVAVLFRFALFYLGAPNYLEEHLEINSPMTSYLTLKEGLFLMEGGISPYAGTVCRHPPLVLLFFWPLAKAPPAAHFCIVVAVDVATALLLRWLAVQYGRAKGRAGMRWREAATKLVEGGGGALDMSQGFEDLVSPAFVGLSYLFNPFVIASSLAMSLQNLHHLALCGCVCLAGSGRPGAAAACLAVLLYLCPLTSLVLVLPCAYLALSQAARIHIEVHDEYVRSKDVPIIERGLLPRLAVFVFGTLLLLGCLYVSSALVMGGDLRFLQATVGTIVSVRDLTPNVGIFWYIFIEVFERYRNIFLLAFHGHVLFYPVPLHLRLGRHQPLGPWLHCTAAIGILTLFRPYPTASDFGLLVSALLIQVELIREAEKTFAFLLSGLLFGLCMFPTMAAVWLTRNAGNANFLYNMTLVINVFGGLLLTEWLRAGLRLRRRVHVASYCRGVLLEALDIALSRPREVKEEAPATVVGEAREGATGTDVEGLRQRRP